MYDTDAPRSHFDSHQLDAVARLVDAVAYCDECVRVACQPSVSTAALLDRAEAELSSHGFRCVRVYGPASGGVGIRELIAQIVGRSDPGVVGDGDLKAGFMALTEPGEGHERVVLLVADAHKLQPSAVQYVQLACQSSSKLQVVLAGQSSLAAILADDRFAYLRQRITRTLEPRSPAHGGAPGLFSKTPKPNPVPGTGQLDTGQLKNCSWLWAKLGAVALPAILIGVIGWQYTPAPSVAEMHASVPAPENASVGQAASVRAESGVSATDAPVAAPDAAGQAGHSPTEAVLPSAASAPNPAGSDAVAPAHAEAAAKPAEKTSASGPAPGPKPAVAAVPTPGEIDAAIKQHPAPAALQTAAPEPPETPAKPAESAAAARDEPPVPVALRRAMGPPQDAAPVALPAPDADPLVPPHPQARASAVAVAPFETVQARHAPRGTERVVAPVAALPVRSTDERHCRAIVLYAQLGEELSGADKQFLRDDCHAQ